MNEIIKRPHAAIVHIPITLYPVSFIFLGMFWYLHDPGFLLAAFWCFMFAVIALVPVSITGFLDMVRLKSQSLEGHRLLTLHLVNGIAITLFGLAAGGYFYLHQPMMASKAILPFAMVSALLSFMVLSQGLIAAIMVYQHHIGIDGETR
jgi:uncharacterized membrane protein